MKTIPLAYNGTLVPEVNRPFSRVLAENLKLPICPKCGETRLVEEITDLVVLLINVERYPWFECGVCGIKWNAIEGIREVDDHRVCWG